MATRKVGKRSTKKAAKRAKPANAPKKKPAKAGKAAKVAKAAKPAKAANTPRIAKVMAPAREPASGFIDRHETVQRGLEALSHRAHSADLTKALRDLNEAYARLLGRNRWQSFNDHRNE